MLNINALERYKKYASSYYDNNSAKSRLSAIKKFIDFLNKNENDISQIDHSSIEVFLTEEFDSELSVITVENDYSYLKGFFRFLKEKGDNTLLDFDKVNFKRINNRVIEIFTDEELYELFILINESKNKLNRVSNRIIFSILLYTGCTLKELNSINVFKNESDVVDEDNYITLDNKKIHFRYPNIREFLLYDCIIKDIEEYYVIIENWLGKNLPARMPLLVSNYCKHGETRKIRRLTYSSVQGRITSIKKLSTFKEKNLSLKNIRHTLINKLIKEKKDLIFISENIGIDLSTLKIYISNQKKTEELAKYNQEHPYRDIIN